MQISWEEALDTIAEKMIEIKEKYGPYGIFHSQYPSFEKNGFPLAPWWEAGFGAWGEHSTSGHAAGEMLHLGVDLTKVTRGLQNSMPGFEAPDLFNSKLFVMWGMDPVVAWFGRRPTTCTLPTSTAARPSSSIRATRSRPSFWPISGFRFAPAPTWP